MLPVTHKGYQLSPASKVKGYDSFLIKKY